MKRPANIKFLTNRENECLEHLLKAQDIFDEICLESPQNPTDSFNFGHYLDAARSAILLRGVRRLDPENLLVKHSPFPDPAIPEGASEDNDGRSVSTGIHMLESLGDELNKALNEKDEED